MVVYRIEKQMAETRPQREVALAFYFVRRETLPAPYLRDAAASVNRAFTMHPPGPLLAGQLGARRDSRGGALAFPFTCELED